MWSCWVVCLPLLVVALVSCFAAAVNTDEAATRPRQNVARSAQVEPRPRQRASGRSTTQLLSEESHPRQRSVPKFQEVEGVDAIASDNNEGSETKRQIEVPLIDSATLEKSQSIKDQPKTRSKRDAEAVFQPSLYGRGSGSHPRDTQTLVSFDSFPRFSFPAEQQRQSREMSTRPRAAPSGSHRDSRRHRHDGGPARHAFNSHEGSHDSHPNGFQSERQRAYPSVNGRGSFSQTLGPSWSSSSGTKFSNEFYPSHKAARGSKNRPTTRARNSLPHGFRDFHETFYGTRAKENRKQKGKALHEEVDNSLLGSGNFEVITGGTFREEEKKYKYHHHPYDSYLDHDYTNDEGASYHQPQTNNYVDDFFPNFRDFSEFSTKKVDKPKDFNFYGYGSENKKIVIPYQGIDNGRTPVREMRMHSSHSAPVAHRLPRNIQEVLEQEDDGSTVPLDGEGTEPLIATF